MNVCTSYDVWFGLALGLVIAVPVYLGIAFLIIPWIEQEKR